MISVMRSPSHLLLYLPKRRKSVGEARRAVTETLKAWGLTGQADDLELTVAELCTNVVSHCRVPYAVIAVSLEWTGSALLLQVADPDNKLPKMREVDDLALGGRGLHLVAELSDSWGVRDRVFGKTVWAQFETGKKSERDISPWVP